MAHGKLLADEIERAWREMTLRPLRFVSGDADLAFAVAAYAPDRPRALPGLPQPSDAELSANGLVVICFADDAGCRSKAAAETAKIGPSREIVSGITRNFLSFPGKPQNYAIIIAPPRAGFAQ